MEYFNLINELFDYRYLLFEEDLKELPADMIENKEDITIYFQLQENSDHDQELRIERNIQIFNNVIKNMPVKESEIEAYEQLINLINSNSSKSDYIVITNYVLGAKIQDMDNFIVHGDKNRPASYPFLIGTLNKLKIYIDPNLSFNDKKIYLFNKNSIKVALYIKDIDIKESKQIIDKITIFKQYNQENLKFLVKISENILL